MGVPNLYAPITAANSSQLSSYSTKQTITEKSSSKASVIGQSMNPYHVSYARSPSRGKSAYKHQNSAGGSLSKTNKGSLDLDAMLLGDQTKSTNKISPSTALPPMQGEHFSYHTPMHQSSGISSGQASHHGIVSDALKRKKGLVHKQTQSFIVNPAHLKGINSNYGGSAGGGVVVSGPAKESPLLSQKSSKMKAAARDSAHNKNRLPPLNQHLTAANQKPPTSSHSSNQYTSLSLAHSPDGKSRGGFHRYNL